MFSEFGDYYKSFGTENVFELSWNLFPGRSLGTAWVYGSKVLVGFSRPQHILKFRSLQACVAGRIFYRWIIRTVASNASSWPRVSRE